MGAPNHDKTHVIMITNGDFPNLKDHDIPNVKANAAMLEEALVKCVGIPQKNIHNYPDKTAGHILEEFQKIIKVCSGEQATLIAYYAGHGFPIPSEGLYWATHDTKKDDNELLYSTAISTKNIRGLMDKCNAKSKILITDCCYAAEFLEGNAGDLTGFMQKNMFDIRGTFYMFSSGPDSESTFPVEKNDSPTFFTDALIRTLKEGLAPEEEYCTIGKLYSKVEQTIEKLRVEYNKHIPSPDRRIDGKADEYILYVNPKYRNQAESDLEQILENPSRSKLVDWMEANNNHPRVDEAIEKLQWYDSAEGDIKKANSLPIELRSAALTELMKKVKKAAELYKFALTSYKNEHGMSAKSNELENSQKEEDSISIRTSRNNVARGAN
ncbi:MAG: caspase family protein [Chitinophagaceae bacterium]